MKLSVRAMATAVAIVWGVLGMFLTGVVNWAWPGYGQAVLDLAASVYPGYRAEPGLGQLGLGTLYGLIDGAIGGAALAWLYNRFSPAKAADA